MARMQNSVMPLILLFIVLLLMTGVLAQEYYKDTVTKDEYAPQDSYPQKEQYKLPSYAEEKSWEDVKTPAYYQPPACSEGVGQCVKNTFQICRGGRWLSEYDCALSERCTPKGCVPAVQVQPRAARWSAQGLSCLRAEEIRPMLPSGPQAEVTQENRNQQLDCQLIGRGEEVERYLRELERVQQGCRDRITADLRRVEQERALLDADINAIPWPQPPQGGEPSLAIQACIEPLYSPLNYRFPEEAQRIRDDFIARYRREGRIGYTAWLGYLSRDVEEYCRDAIRIISEIQSACQDINSHATCVFGRGRRASDADIAGYHSIVSQMMTAVQRTAGELRRLDDAVTQRRNAFRAEYREPLVACGQIQLSTAPLPEVAHAPAPPSPSIFERIRSFFTQLFGR